MSSIERLFGNTVERWGLQNQDRGGGVHCGGVARFTDKDVTTRYPEQTLPQIKWLTMDTLRRAESGVLVLLVVHLPASNRLEL